MMIIIMMTTKLMMTMTIMLMFYIQEKSIPTARGRPVFVPEEWGSQWREPAKNN